MQATQPHQQPGGWHIRLSRNEKGQGIIEMVLILPVILLIMAGIFDFGRVIHAYVVVVNAAREAAFAGATAQMSDSELQTFMDDELARGGVSSGTATSVIAYALKGIPPKQTLVIDLSYEVPLVVLILPFSDITVTSHAEMITFWN